MMFLISKWLTITKIDKGSWTARNNDMHSAVHGCVLTRWTVLCWIKAAASVSAIGFLDPNEYADDMVYMTMIMYINKNADKLNVLLIFISNIITGVFSEQSDCKDLYLLDNQP